MVARPGNLPDANWLHLEDGGVQRRLQAKRQVQCPRNLASRVLPVSPHSGSEGLKYDGMSKVRPNEESLKLT
jgi:hypothetical protein